MKKNTINFFTNDRLVLGDGNVEVVNHPKDTRDKEQTTFKAPLHTTDSKSILVFLDGKLCIKDRDYEDINSEEISFKEPIGTERDVVIVCINEEDYLAQNKGGMSWGEF